MWPWPVSEVPELGDAWCRCSAVDASVIGKPVRQLPRNGPSGSGKACEGLRLLRSLHFELQASSLKVDISS